MSTILAENKRERSQNGMIKATRLNQGVTLMPMNYAEKLQNEIAHVPQEYLPALLNIVHSFRETVSLKTKRKIFQTVTTWLISHTNNRHSPKEAHATWISLKTL